VDTLLAEKLAAILPYLKEKQRRLLLAAEARAMGHGGVARVARASGASRQTLHRGLRELERPLGIGERIRHVGGGRKQTRDRDPQLVVVWEALVDPSTRGIRCRLWAGPAKARGNWRRL